MLLFSEVFAALLLCLVFLSLKYRKDLIDRSRDPILTSAAHALSLFGVTMITYKVCGLNFSNPMVALLQVESAAIFVPRQNVTNITTGNVTQPPNTDVANQTIRIFAPFVGALIAAMFFSFQVDTINNLSASNGSNQTEVKEEVTKQKEDTGIQFQQMLTNMTQTMNETMVN